LPNEEDERRLAEISKQFGGGDYQQDYQGGDYFKGVSGGHTEITSTNNQSLRPPQTIPAPK